MQSPPRRFRRALLGGLLLIGAVMLATVLRWTTADVPESSGEMARANPGLKIAESVGGRVLVSAPDGADAVFMRATDARPHEARRARSPMQSTDRTASTMHCRSTPSTGATALW